MPNPDDIRLILVIIAGLSFLAMFKRPFYGLICYLIVMMIQPGLYYPELAELRVELLVGIAIIVVIFLSPSRLQLIKFNEDGITKWMFILFGVMLLSMLQAFDIESSWEWTFEFSKIFLFFIMVITLIDNESDIQIFLFTFAFITALISYSAIYNYFEGIITKSLGGGIDYAKADTGMGSGHVALANIILQSMPVMWFLASRNSKIILKIFGLLLFILCFYGVVISGSRGGFIGIIVLWICIAWFSKNRFILICMGILSILTIPLFSQSSYMDYMSNAVVGNLDNSGESRFTGLRNGVEMLMRRPLLGVGPGCYPIARKAWFGWGLWAHNHYGELMGDLGIIGTVVWFIFLKKYFMAAWNMAKIANDNSIIKAFCLAIIVSTIVRLVLGMATHSVYIFFWYMMAGIIVVINRLNIQRGMLSKIATAEG